MMPSPFFYPSFSPDPDSSSLVLKSKGVVPCRNSLDGNVMCFLNGLLLLVMPNNDLPGP